MTSKAKIAILLAAWIALVIGLPSVAVEWHQRRAVAGCYRRSCPDGMRPALVRTDATYWRWDDAECLCVVRAK
jgi:hypothetical protein